MITKEGLFQLQTPPEQVLFSVRGANYVSSAFRRSTINRPQSASPIKHKKLHRVRPSTAFKSDRRRVQPPDGGMSIFKASQALDMERVQYLLHSKFSNATDRNQYLQTPLHYVVRKSSDHKKDVLVQKSCVKIGALLLQWGANMHAENNVGASPVSAAAAFSPIMSALFRRYLDKHGDTNGWPRDTRTPMQILDDETRMKKVHKAAKKKKWKEKNARTVEFHQHLKQWKHDFHSMEKRDPWLLRKFTSKASSPKDSNGSKRFNRTKTATNSSRDQRWWSSVDVQLHRAQQSMTSNDKVNQWQRELDRRRAIDQLKSGTLQSYCGKGIVKEKKTRSNRLMRFHAAKQLDLAVQKQEGLERFRHTQMKEQRKQMTPSDLRGYALRQQFAVNIRAGKKEKDTAFVLNPNKQFPIGCFTLDSENDIKRAFSILADGKLTIQLPVLMYYLSTIGDPPLDQQELDEIREEISKFALGPNTSYSKVGSLTIDYEKFVEAMRLMSRKQDAIDTAGKAMFKQGDALY